jgi:hypothetical protein
LNWKTVGWVVAGFRGGPSEWHPVGDGARFGVTLEGYSGTTPLVFQVPPVGAGEYRIRLDFIDGAGGSVRERTATLYAFLRVIDAPPTHT